MRWISSCLYWCQCGSNLTSMFSSTSKFTRGRKAARKVTSMQSWYDSSHVSATIFCMCVYFGPEMVTDRYKSCCCYHFLKNPSEPPSFCHTFVKFWLIFKILSLARWVEWWRNIRASDFLSSRTLCVWLLAQLPYRQVVDTHVPLSPCSIIWYQLGR